MLGGFFSYSGFMWVFNNKKQKNYNKNMLNIGKHIKINYLFTNQRLRPLMLIELVDIESLKFVIETTTTTSGTTNLNNLSKTKQVFIGNLDQYVVLPNTTTLNNGQCFEIINQTTGNTINVKKYDNNSVGSVAKNETLRCICIDKNGTNGNSGWFFENTTEELKRNTIYLTAQAGAYTYPLTQNIPTVIQGALPSGVNSTFTLPTATINQGECRIYFTTGATIPTLVYSGFTPIWGGGTAPTLEANKVYIMSFEQVQTTNGAWQVLALCSPKF